MKAGADVGGEPDDAAGVHRDLRSYQHDLSHDLVLVAAGRGARSPLNQGAGLMTFNKTPFGSTTTKRRCP